jgi:hypothetical protein
MHLAVGNVLVGLVLDVCDKVQCHGHGDGDGQNGHKTERDGRVGDYLVRLLALITALHRALRDGRGGAEYVCYHTLIVVHSPSGISTPSTTHLPSETGVRRRCTRFIHPHACASPRTHARTPPCVSNNCITVLPLCTAA